MVRVSQVPTSSSSSYGPDLYGRDPSSTSTTVRRRSGSSYGFPKKCFCGLDTVMRTSLTAENPGRRFFGCRNYDDGGYHIMKWWDEAMTEEFNDVKLFVDQHGQRIDGMVVSDARSDKCLSTVVDDVKVMKAEIAQLKEQLKEKPCGQIMRGVELRSLMIAGAAITVLAMSISVAFF